jgi:branched-chain amino acid transport system substrate-binding protein
MPRRQPLAQRLRIAGVGLALVAAACAGPKVQTGLPVGPRPAAPAPVAAAAPTRAPDAVRNRVALLVPMTGANAAVGQSIANAATMALLDLGDTRINLQVYDTAAGGAGAAAAKAVGDGAKLFLGPLLAGDVRAVQGVASANGVPVLAFSNDAALAGGGTFVMGFQPGQSIARVVAYARSRGVERFAALVPSGVYGQRAGTAFLRAVEAAGGKAVAVTSYSRTSAGLLQAARKLTDYDARHAAAAKTAALRPDGTIASVSHNLAPVGFQALLIADSGSIAAAVAPALVQFGATPVLIMGTELWNSEPAIAQAPALNGAVFAAVPDDRFNQLAVRYRAKFGGAPSRLASFGYDAVLLVNGVAGNGWATGAPFPRAGLSAAGGFTGIDGVFRFSGAGIAERGLEVEQVGPKGFTVVAAAPKALN